MKPQDTTEWILSMSAAFGEIGVLVIWNLCKILSNVEI